MGIEWLIERKKGIGGSDVAAILGISPFKSALDIYNDKISELIKKDNEENNSLIFGKILEPVILDFYLKKTGEKLSKFDQIIKKEFMIASLDGMTESGKVIEIKTSRTDKGWGEEGTSEIPIYYTSQVQHYLMVTGCKSADVAVLIAGSDFRIYHIEENKELQNLLFEKEKKFWDMVCNRIPPEPTTHEDLKNLYPFSNQNSIEATYDIFEKIGLLASLNSNLKELEKRIDDIKLELKLFMKENESISFNNDILITYKTSKGRESIDWKNIAEGLLNEIKDFGGQFLEIVNEIIKINTRESLGSRRFLIK